MSFVCKFRDRDVVLTGPESVIKLLGSVADSVLPEMVAKLIEGGVSMDGPLDHWLNERCRKNRQPGESDEQCFVKAFVGHGLRRPPRDSIGAEVFRIGELDRHRKMAEGIAKSDRALIEKSAPKPKAEADHGDGSAPRVQYDHGGRLGKLVSDHMKANPKHSRSKALDAIMRTPEGKAIRDSEKRAQGIAV